MNYRTGGKLFLLILILLLASPVWAQSGPTATLTSPETGAFPRIVTFLDIQDDLGRFIHGLKPSDMSFIEDNISIPAIELLETRPGAQFVLAISPAPPFALRNTQGATRLELIQETLQDWANSRRASSLDDLSLLITAGRQVTHTNDPTQWAAGLNLEDINARQAEPSLDTLLQAIEVASDSTPRPGMGRAVLFIAPPIEDQTQVAVENIIGRAKQAGVSVFIWMVPVPGAYYPVAEQQFGLITSQTGGKLFTYTDDQPTLDLENLIEPFRLIYKAAYNSLVRVAGSHQVAAELQTPAGMANAAPQTYELNLQSPQPAFVNPPLEIKRRPALDEEGQVLEDVPVEDYLPVQQDLEFLVTFPDERARPIVRSALFIDGVMVQENRQPPFERFTWDLKQYPTSGIHSVRIEAEDQLGLVGTSIERLVQLTIDMPARSPWAWVSNNAIPLSILGTVVAGSILILVLLLGGRLRPHVPLTHRTGRRRSDPVTQPVPIKVDAPSRRISGWVKNIPWPQRAAPPKANAFLKPVTNTDSSQAAAPIPIMTDEVTLGSNPDLAMLVLNDPSVEGLHARITHLDGDAYRISDEGSIAGTWINYSPISKEGAQLEHGDLIHIGRVAFRFTLRQGQAARKVVITPANLDEGPRQ